MTIAGHNDKVGKRIGPVVGRLPSSTDRAEGGGEGANNVHGVEMANHKRVVEVSNKTQGQGATESR
jgi:hypothetical protein